MTEVRKVGRQISKTWTKDEIKKVINLWESSSISDICEDLKISKLQLQYVVNALRREGMTLTKKHRLGTLRSLVKDVIAELA